MSVSVSAYGLPVDDIFAMFGSGNRKLVAGLAEQLPVKEALVLDRAVAHGVPFEELETEGLSHIMLMKWLLEKSQEQTWGDATFRRSWIVDQVLEPLLVKLEPRSRSLISYFVDGRPIFGKNFGSTESGYGYLNANEVIQLNFALQPLRLPDADSAEWDDLPMELLESPFAEFTGALLDLLPLVIAKKHGLAILIG